MKDILARNPQLEDIIRKAANRLGENHGLTRDNHGATIDNQGNSSRYVGSGGRHPYRYGQPTQPSSGGWHRTLNEGGCGDREMYEGGCGDYEGEMEEGLNPCPGMSCKDGMTVNPNTCKCERTSYFGEDYELEEERGSPKNRLCCFPKKLPCCTSGKMAQEKRMKKEMEEVTGASSAGSYEGPLFGTMTESERILKSVIREEISKKISKTQLKESLKNRITRNLLNEKAFYNTGEFKYEKPTKLPGEIKSMPGMKQTDSTLKKSKSTNNEYLKHFDKKIKNYLDFEGNSHPEFPHQNNSKTDYKSPMYRNTGEDQEFIDDFRGMGLEDANGADMLDRMDDYLSGSQETGNAQTGKDGKALGNVVPSKTGDRIKKKVKRKKEKIAKQKSKMTNLRGMTPDVQTTTTVKEEVKRMKGLIKYSI